MCFIILGDDIEHWVGCSVSQSVFLSLEIKWTAELYSALTSENPLQQLRHIRSDIKNFTKKNFFMEIFLVSLAYIIPHLCNLVG